MVGATKAFDAQLTRSMVNMPHTFSAESTGIWREGLTTWRPPRQRFCVRREKEREREGIIREGGGDATHMHTAVKVSW